MAGIYCGTHRADHVRDLPEKAIGIDVKNNFKPEYVIYPKKQDVVRRLAGLSKKAEKVYLATDPDREGEAISWLDERFGA